MEDFSFPCTKCTAKFDGLRELRKHNCSLNLQSTNENKVPKINTEKQTIKINQEETEAESKVLLASKNSDITASAEQSSNENKVFTSQTDLTEKQTNESKQEEAAEASVREHNTTIEGNVQNDAKQNLGRKILKIKLESRILRRRDRRPEKTGNGILSFKCDSCDVMFTSFHGIHLHKTVHKGLCKTMTCEHCGKVFDRKSSKNVDELDNHIKKQHSGSTCKICGQLLKTASGYEAHMDMHNESPVEIVCEECGKSFKTKEDKRVHKIKVHTPDYIYPYTCKICGKNMLFKFEFNAHMTVHTGEKSVQCDKCPKIFRLQGQLKNHQIVHTGEKAHLCTICSKQFGLKKRLAVHMKRHLNQRNYICSVCAKSFIENSDLRRHKCTGGGGEAEEVYRRRRRGGVGGGGGGGSG